MRWPSPLAIMYHNFDGDVARPTAPPTPPASSYSLIWMLSIYPLTASWKEELKKHVHGRHQSRPDQSAGRRNPMVSCTCTRENLFETLSSIDFISDFKNIAGHTSFTLLLQLDCRSARRTRKINFSANQKGYDNSGTTVGKLSARKNQICPDYFCLGHYFESCIE